jgi:membrane fusion protein (multidrug efflux system)
MFDSEDSHAAPQVLERSQIAPRITAPEAPRAADPKPADPEARRKRLLTWLGAGVAVAALGYGGYSLAFAGRTVSTDNAYVGAETAQVTPLISGPVARVLVRETQVVKAGQPLVVLDDADQRIAVAQAEAALGEARRKVRGLAANDGALSGLVGARQADLAKAQADVSRARTDLDRRQALAGSGAVSGDELTAAKNAFAGAQAGVAQASANLKAAQGTRQANLALISGQPLEQNPEVMAARAQLDAARLALSRTVIRAPLDGVVTKKAVQVGQQVQAGAPLMVVAPLGSAYVDANFKEGQLTKVRPGQPVVLTSDLYGSGVKFHGRVTGLSGGTGAAFSLIPAQNASGNWIKVVQRVPVRVQLDPRELSAHPLRVGLSMKTTIDVSRAG